MQVVRMRSRLGTAALFLLAALSGVVTSRFTSPAEQAARRGDLSLSAEQREILSHLSLVHLDDGRGGRVKTLRVSGVNVQIVNGLGATNGYPLDPESRDPGVTATNGAGNLIIGYNEHPGGSGGARTGSHNLVVGMQHAYESFGGSTLGFRNTSGAPYACVSGGAANRALAEFASVTGGTNNDATGPDASVTGGFLNVASGQHASVTGGSQNAAIESFATVTGGTSNVASGSQSTVTGGGFNIASGFIATVSGGSSRQATGSFNWSAGSLQESF